MKTDLGPESTFVGMDLHTIAAHGHLGTGTGSADVSTGIERILRSGGRQKFQFQHQVPKLSRKPDGKKQHDGKTSIADDHSGDQTIFHAGLKVDPQIDNRFDDEIEGPNQGQKSEEEHLVFRSFSRSSPLLFRELLNQRLSFEHRDAKEKGGEKIRDRCLDFVKEGIFQIKIQGSEKQGHDRRKLEKQSELFFRNSVMNDFGNCEGDGSCNRWFQSPKAVRDRE